MFQFLFRIELKYEELLDCIILLSKFYSNNPFDCNSIILSAYFCGIIEFKQSLISSNAFSNVFLLENLLKNSSLSHKLSFNNLHDKPKDNPAIVFGAFPSRIKLLLKLSMIS